MSTPAAGVDTVHRLIEHLIATPEDRAALRDDPDGLFARFDVPRSLWPLLRSGDRDQLAAAGVHPNFVVKWLIWSGRATIRGFDIGYYLKRS